MGNQQPEVQFVEIRNTRMAYASRGRGEPLILCPGYASHMDSWAPAVIERFERQYRVIVFDYRGMGLSGDSAAAFTISDLADDVRALLDALQIPRAHVLGWSMGSYVAQMLAVRHTEYVHKLVLYAANHGDVDTLPPAPEIIAVLSNPSASPVDMLRTLFPDDWLAHHPEPWKFLPTGQEPCHPRTIARQYDAVQSWLSPGGGSTGQLHTLTMPVLLICGDQDKIVPSENSARLKVAIGPSATLIQVPDSGHGLMYQLPEVFSDHVLEFLAGDPA